MQSLSLLGWDNLLGTAGPKHPLDPQPYSQGYHRDSRSAITSHSQIQNRQEDGDGGRVDRRCNRGLVGRGGLSGVVERVLGQGPYEARVRAGSRRGRIHCRDGCNGRVAVVARALVVAQRLFLGHRQMRASRNRIPMRREAFGGPPRRQSSTSSECFSRSRTTQAGVRLTFSRGNPGSCPGPARRFVSAEQAQGLLQRTGRHAGRIVAGFDALAVQVRELPGNVNVQIPSGGPPAKVAVKLVQERCL